jgi:hypothetical protein
MPGMPVPGGHPTPGVPGPIPGLGALPGVVVAPADDVDPIKATGKRIGLLNGKAIFKHEDAYYFDPKAEKPKK